MYSTEGRQTTSLLSSRNKLRTRYPLFRRAKHFHDTDPGYTGTYPTLPGKDKLQRFPSNKKKKSLTSSKPIYVVGGLR